MRQHIYQWFLAEFYSILEKNSLKESRMVILRPRDTLYTRRTQTPKSAGFKSRLLAKNHFFYWLNDLFCAERLKSSRTFFLSYVTSHVNLFQISSHNLRSIHTLDENSISLVTNNLIQMKRKIDLKTTWCQLINIYRRASRKHCIVASKLNHANCIYSTQ